MMTREDALYAMNGATLIQVADKLGVKVNCNKTRTALKEAKSKVIDRILVAEGVTTTAPTTETTVPTTEPAVDTTTAVEPVAEQPAEAPVKKVKKTRKVKVAVTPEVVTTFIDDLTSVVADTDGFELKTWDKIKNLYAVRYNGKTVIECYVGKKNYRVNVKVDRVPEGVEYTTVKNYYLPACIKAVAYTDRLVFNIIDSFNN